MSLRKRMIFTLLWSDGNFMLSRNFKLQKVGGIDWLFSFFELSSLLNGIDELIILNVSRDDKNLELFQNSIEVLVSKLFIPITLGGGISNIDDADFYFNCGADKISVNSLFFSDQTLIVPIIEKYGKQSVVCSIDYKLNDCERIVYIKNGSISTELSLTNYLLNIDSNLFGEILLNSMNKDGTGMGLDIELIPEIQNLVNCPIILSGGAGNVTHIFNALQEEEISGISTANLFNFMGDNLLEIRGSICEKNDQLLASWMPVDYIIQ